MNSFPLSHRRKVRQGAVAIIIVLAFVVLLTGLVVAFFSTSILYRQISNSSANATKTDLFAQGALDTITGDLKEEIAAGSTIAATPTPGITIYTPNSLAMVPCPVGTPIPGDKPTLNLVKRSAYNLPFYANPTPSGSASPAPSPYPDLNAYPPSNRAANVHSTALSLNGRSISPARWNKHLLLPKASSVTNPTSDSNDTDFTPVNATAASGTTAAAWNYAPDWVLVDRSGKNPTAWNSNMVGSTTSQTSVLGRYAYAIYDEGGLLDVNAAGYPLSGTASGNPLYTTANSDVKAAYKGALAFADLSQLPGISALTAAHQQTLINNLVGWRNYASAQPQGTLNNFTFNANPVSSANPTPPGSIYGFTNLVLGNWTGFLKASNTAPFNNQSDRTFASRQQFLKFLQNGTAQNGTSSAWSATEIASLQNASQYLTTFSRDLDQPSYAPPAGRPRVLNVELGGNAIAPDIAPPIVQPPAPATYDDLINPNFAAVRVTTTLANGRFDGTDLVAGEPVVKKRFNLNRLAWITWEGPSYQASAATKNALLANGISQSMIDEGTEGNIAHYFGLAWDPTKKLWNYNIHNGGEAGYGAIMRLGRPPSVITPDATHYVQDAGREADFFELLKAAINVGSLGKAAVTPATQAPNNPDGTQSYPTQYVLGEVPSVYRRLHDISVDAQIIQIGANIIDQFDSDSYTTRIVFNGSSTNDPSAAIEYDGVEDLPYIDYFVNGMLRAEPPGSNPTAFFSDGGGQPTPEDPHTPNGFTQNPGVGVLLEIPALWNPHDVNGLKQEKNNGGGSTPFQRPTNFRVVADSADPSLVATGSTAGYHSIYVTSVAHDNAGHILFASQAANGGVTDPNYQLDYANPPAGHILTPANTALTFTDSNGALFREPTLLLRTGGAMQLQVPAHSGGFASVDADPLGLPSRKEGNPATGPGNPPTDPAGTSFAGILLGAFPLRFSANDGTTHVVQGQTVPNVSVMYSYAAYAGPAGGPVNTNLRFPYLTYRTQYQDSSGNWVTYDTKYGRVFIGRIDCPGAVSHMLEPNSGAPNQYSTMFDPWSWSTTTDPRTARFGFMTAVESWQGSSPYCTFASPAEGDSYGWLGYPTAGVPPSYDPNYGGWIADTAYAGVQAVNPTTGVTFSLRPDNFGGSFGVDYSTQLPNGQSDYRMSTSDDPMLDNPFPKGAAGWAEPAVFTFGFRPRYLFAPGMYTQNNSYVPFFVRRMTTTPQMVEEVPPDLQDQDGQASGCPQPAYYADADGVVRRAMGAYVPPGPQGPPSWPREAALNTIGLPMAITQYSPSASQFTPPPAATSPFTQTQSRPLVLNRPFRSPAELGYVFSDTPWKNLDFFTPESPDNALLDVFCTTDTDDPTARTAGKVNLNTKQAPVVAAIVSGAYVDDPGLVSNATIGTLSTSSSSTVASAIASALTARTTDTALGAGPLQNIADLTGRWVSKQPVAAPNKPGGPVINPSGAKPPNTGGTGAEEHDGYVPDARRGDIRNYLYDTHYSDGRRSYAGFSGPDPSAVDPTTNLPNGSTVPETLSAAYKASTTTYGSNLSSTTNAAIATALNQVQRFHEAPIRALSSTGQTRVWNLLIDLVAQTGRYPQSATKLENFTVEGEQRYWVHLAIDRITGQVIDKQIEIVKE